MVLTLAVALGVLALIGCEESASVSRRERLLADENQQLQQQLQACQTEVEKQKQLLAEAQKQTEQIAADSGEANIKLLKAMGDMGKQVEALTAENTRLKAELEALKAGPKTDTTGPTP